MFKDVQVIKNPGALFNIGGCLHYVKDSFHLIKIWCNVQNWKFKVKISTEFNWLNSTDLNKKIPNLKRVKYVKSVKTSFSSVDTNLIQLDTDDVLATNTNATYADNDDDIIFEVTNNVVILITSCV